MVAQFARIPTACNSDCMQLWQCKYTRFIQDLCKNLINIDLILIKLNYNSQYLIQKLKLNEDEIQGYYQKPSVRINCFFCSSRCFYNTYLIIVQIQQNRFRGQIVKSIFSFVAPYGQNYSLFLLRLLTRHQLLKNSSTDQLANKILMQGFDQEGSHLRGLQKLGLGGVQIGPVTKQPSLKSQNSGLRMVKSNINSYLEQYYTDESSPQHYLAERNKRIQKFKIGVNILPDDDVVQYTPYIIPQNLLQALDLLDKSYQYPQSQKKGSKQQKTNVEPQATSQQNFKLDNRIIDFVTVDQKKIVSQLGDSAKVETTQMMKKFFNEAEPLVKKQKIALYKIQQQKYQPIHVPLTDRTSALPYKNYQFITWQEIVQEILKD